MGHYTSEIFPNQDKPCLSRDAADLRREREARGVNPLRITGLSSIIEIQVVCSILGALLRRPLDNLLGIIYRSYHPHRSKNR